LEASQKLPSISNTQIKWAYQHSFEHLGFRTKRGLINCLECGASWKNEHTLIDSILGCTCPNCRMKLDIRDTLKRVFKDTQYFCIITTCDGFQVLRFFYLSYHAKAGRKACYFHKEVAQRWIASSGRNEVIARLHPVSYFGENWTMSSKLEIRPKRDYHNIAPKTVYSRQRLIPEIKRNGYNGDFHKFTPYKLFHVLLSENKAETLLKTKQTGLLRYFSVSNFHNIGNYWTSIKICIRNGFQIYDASMWCDYIDLLRFFGKDLHNVKYVCPADLKTEHDKYVAKKREWQKRQKKEKAKQKALEDNKRFTEMKSRFFGIEFTDGLIQVRVLKSVEEIMEEGDALHHCVFTNEYHLKPDALILSASIDGKRVETIELSLSELQIIQSRGIRNNVTKHHNRIITLVKKNMFLIQKQLAA
jgi:hypothetical protein